MCVNVRGTGADCVAGACTGAHTCTCVYLRVLVCTCVAPAVTAAQVCVHVCACVAPAVTVVTVCADAISSGDDEDDTERSEDGGADGEQISK